MKVRYLHLELQKYDLSGLDNNNSGHLSSFVDVVDGDLSNVGPFTDEVDTAGDISQSFSLDVAILNYLNKYLLQKHRKNKNRK